MLGFVAVASLIVSVFVLFSTEPDYSLIVANRVYKIESKRFQFILVGNK